MRRSLVVIPMLLCIAWAGSFAVEPTGDSPPTVRSFRLQDHLGTWHELDDLTDRRLVVVAFLGTECPLTKLYGSRLGDLHRRYRDAGVAFVGINANLQDTPTKIGHYSRQHGIEFPILKDPGNQVADQFSAQRTPEVYVLDPARQVRYQGRIDDQFGVGYSRSAATNHYLREALDDLLEGRAVRVPHTEAVGCFIGRVSRREPRGEITYSNQISRLIQQRCLECHRDGGIAPFALSNYEEVSGWAETLLEVVQIGRMPPWHANPDYGHFANDARMPEAEKRLLAEWVANGLPEGDQNQLPPPREFVDGWRIGQPDLVVQMPEPFVVPAHGVVPYQYIVVDPQLEEDRWIRLAEARPGNRSVVHHILVFIQPPGRDFDIGQEGDRLQDAVFQLEMLGGYVPGMQPLGLGADTARFMPAGSRLLFQMHYTPTGTDQADRSEIGLVFADPTEVRKTVQLGAAANTDFAIPPHADDYRVTAWTRFSHDTYLHALTPHMHYRGKSFRYEARYPNGTREILLDVPRYDFNWQNVYQLAEPQLMPEGTILYCTAHFDNSQENLANPDPSIRVTWGEQTWEEMMIGYFEGVLVQQNLSPLSTTVAQIDENLFEVRFRYRPDRPVRTVHLAGSFNDWNNSEHRLDGPDAEGFYTSTRSVPAGIYHYKFVLDGEYWTPDPANGRQAGILRESYFVAGKAKEQ